MNCEELQIDDWVEYNGLNQKVKEISGLDNEIYLTMDECVDCAEVNPIPLTAEILEKNGFESDNNMFGLCDYELSENYILENRGDRFCFVKRIPRHYGTFHIIGIKYLHELQHVLKFFEIEREIKL